MRQSESEPELRLETELKALYAQFGDFQGATGETRRERFEMPLNLFQLRWEERLVDLEIAELRGCRTLAQATVQKQAEAEKSANNARDFEAIKELDPITMDKMWNAVDRSTEPSSLFVKEREEKVREVYDAGAAVIKAQYAQLRDQLDAGVRDIEAGREPSLARFAEGLSQAILEPRTIQEYRQQRAAELVQQGPGQSQEIDQTQAKSL